MTRKKLFLVLIAIHIFVISWGQEFQLKGTVSSPDGETLIGVNIVIQGTRTGTVTDMNGNYLLNVKPGDIIDFSYVGFQKQTVTITNQRILDIVLSDTNILDDLVVVGYAQVKRITLTGSVSTISAKELTTIPTSNVQNALYGKIPGFFSQQRSGQPGRDASDFFIRGVSSLNDAGNQPLIIVDDVQYSYDQLQQINVNEIESISILKDASTTAIYGIKGANGVLVVKTKRGSMGKPQIGIRLESGVQMPVRTPKFLNSYETAMLMNEALINDGENPRFTPDEIDKFKSGIDPYGYPDVNWYNEIFKKVAFQANANIDISGGTDRVRYFITGGYFWQNGLTRNFDDPYDDLNTSYFYRRFNYRTNLDFDVTQTLNMRLDMNARQMNINEPHAGNATGQIYDFTKMRPYTAPVLNPNGTYAYHAESGVEQNPTLNARLASEGYNRYRRTDYNILYGATQKLDFITDGLSTSLRIAYSSVDENRRRAYRITSYYPSFHYNSSTKTYTLRPGTEGYDYQPYVLTGDHERYSGNVNIQAFLNYSRSFNETHNILAMVLYNRQSQTNDRNSEVPQNFQGVTGTVNYNFKNKYLLDLNLAYNGTDRFEKNNRYGFFPAVGVGYNIAEEMFFKDRFPNIRVFKIRGSIGLVGSDATPGNRYLYKQVYESSGNYSFGDYVSNYPAVREGTLGNEGIVWEKARKFNIGIDANFYNKVTVMIDFFHDNRYDQLVEPQDVSRILGIGLPRMNMGETVNRGFDGQIGYNDRFGNVHFNTSLVFSFAKNKVIYKAEAEQRYEWLKETGRPIGQPFGYIFVGYYTPEEAKTAKDQKENLDMPVTVAVPRTDVAIQGGDLKYEDKNNDGVIDDYDKGPIGKPNLPSTTMGWTIGGQWKGFSLSLLFQGSFDYSFSIVGTGIESFQSQFQPVHQTRWTLERYNNGEKIDFPRLTSIGSTVNSSKGYASDYWLVNAWYIRLKTVDLSYHLPLPYLPKGIDNARLYVTAYNLYTKTNYDKYQQDPEIRTNSAGDAYMNQKVINLGIQVTF